MPGIAGIVSFNNENDSIKKNVLRMAKILSLKSDKFQDIVVNDNSAFVVNRLGEDNLGDFVAEDKNIILLFWGNIHDKKELFKKYSKEININIKISIGRLLLNIFYTEGISGFYQLNGRFVIALLDKKKKIFKLITDRHGFCKLFYWISSGCLLFASEYKAIACHKSFRKKVDIESLGDFMALGYVLGDKTFFEEIRLLPYGSVLTFLFDDKLLIERYWDYSFQNHDSPLREVDDYIDEYYVLLEQSVRRQVEDKEIIGLPLSGGLDSRALAGMLNKINFRGKVKAFSYGAPNCFDVIYGKRIAKKLNYEHAYIPLNDAYLKINSEAFVWLTEGMINCLNAHILLTHSYINESKIDAIVTGFLGDTIGGEPVIGGLEPFKESLDENEFLRRIFSNQADVMSEDDFVNYFKSDIFDGIRDKTFTTYKYYYSKAPSNNRYYKSMYAELIGRQRRYTSFNIYAFECLTEVLSPFTDKEFVNFALQIPDVLAFTRFVQKEMIIKYLPKVASVSWNKTRLPLNASWIRKGLHWRWERLNHNSLIRATIGRKYAMMNDDYLNIAETIRTGSRDFVIKHIKGNPFLAEYFKMDRVHQMLDDHMSGKSNEHGKITGLLTLSLWYKLFIDRGGIET
jgi:asparagine synthase (glutamine-hydrolysing)